MKLKIDGEIWDVDHVSNPYPGQNAAEIRSGSVGHGVYFLVVDDNDTATEIAKDRWREMDAKELICMVGEERIVEMWTNGTTLENWLEDIDPAQELAGYDGEERDVQEIKWDDLSESEQEELLEALEADPEGVKGMTEEEALAYNIQRVLDQLAEEVEDELGFEPTLAYRTN